MNVMRIKKKGLKNRKGQGGKYLRKRRRRNNIKSQGPRRMKRRRKIC